jgi:hypothetical protein
VVLNGIAIERWPLGKAFEVVKWLEDRYGKPTKQTWYKEYDFDLVTLVMNDEIYIWYMLRWAEV